jgi:hypothetical protein
VIALAGMPVIVRHAILCAGHARIAARRCPIRN